MTEVDLEVYNNNPPTMLMGQFLIDRCFAGEALGHAAASLASAMLSDGASPENCSTQASAWRIDARRATASA